MALPLARLPASADARPPLRPAPLTYSPSITIPLTHDCPWHCTYCGYRSADAAPQGLISEAELDRLFALAKKHRATELLLMSGEMPDTLPHLREELRARGHASFLDFALAVGRRALAQGFLPHTNIGALAEKQLIALREVNASQGLMLENIDDTFNRRVAPEKSVTGRLRTIAAAGRARVPYTSGLLIGLGESHASRRASLRALAELHGEHGHLQEIIIQNYVTNADSRWTIHEQISLAEYFDLIALWREIAPEVAIQIPPNLNPYWRDLLPYIDDLGGISIEGDLINPLNPWSQVETYGQAAREVNRELVPRLPVYPKYVNREWLCEPVLAVIAAQTPSHQKAPSRKREDIWQLPTQELQEQADALNRQLHGDAVTYVVNRNANFTNICNVGCAFCGFQRTARAEDAYVRTPEEIMARLAETPQITEVCMQGGIHPELGFDYYLELVRALKAWRPDLHIHAFSPMEIQSLHYKTGWSYEKVLATLQEAGLNTLPGTAAEILDDAVRAEISSRKLGAADWVEIIRTAHRLGLRTSSTIMYGHIETWDQIRAHFETLRRIQDETGGFTEIVPLQFIPNENPLGQRIQPDPAQVRAKTERLYSLARLFFADAIEHVQTSWVKLGPKFAAQTLHWGCDDFGGTLYEESITRSSGGVHGECLLPEEIENVLRAVGKIPQQRRTIY